jgi:hypothetical protein
MRRVEFGGQGVKRAAQGIAAAPGINRPGIDRPRAIGLTRAAVPL